MNRVFYLALAVVFGYFAYQFMIGGYPMTPVLFCAAVSATGAWGFLSKA